MDKSAPMHLGRAKRRVRAYEPSVDRASGRQLARSERARGRV